MQHRRPAPSSSGGLHRRRPVVHLASPGPSSTRHFPHSAQAPTYSAPVVSSTVVVLRPCNSSCGPFPPTRPTVHFLSSRRRYSLPGGSYGGVQFKSDSDVLMTDLRSLNNHG